MHLNIKKINKLREVHNINQATLAKKMNISRQRISLILNGKKQSHTFNTVNSLAKALGVKATDLIED